MPLEVKMEQPFPKRKESENFTFFLFQFSPSILCSFNSRSSTAIIRPPIVRRLTPDLPFNFYFRPSPKGLFYQQRGPIQWACILYIITMYLPILHILCGHFLAKLCIVLERFDKYQHSHLSCLKYFTLNQRFSTSSSLWPTFVSKIFQADISTNKNSM